MMRIINLRIVILFFIGSFFLAPDFFGTMKLFAQEDSVYIQKWSTKLEQKEQSLNKREQQLQEKERQISIFENELRKRMDELEQTKTEIQQIREDVKVKEDENLDKLAKIYESTKAKDAAKIIVNMELRKAVSLFQRMRSMPAGEIMSAMGRINPEFASRITEQLTPRVSSPGEN